MMKMMPPTFPRTPLRSARGLAAALLVSAGAALPLAPEALAQNDTLPVFVEDSQRAAGALPRVGELLASDLVDEAVRVLQELLETDAERLVAVEGDEDLFVSVRSRVHAELLAREALLRSYRELHSARAQALFQAGEYVRVERDYLLTPAGYESALEVARAHRASARFFAAWSVLAQVAEHPDRDNRASELLSSVTSYITAMGRAGELPRNAEAVLESFGVAEALGAGDVRVPELPETLRVTQRASAVRLEGVLAQPLASRTTGALTNTIETMRNNVRNSALPRSGRVLHNAPAVMGDRVFTNNAQTISAFDRFTGERLWSRDVVGDLRVRQQAFGSVNTLSEVFDVALGDGAVVALTGIASRGAFADRVLSSLDPETGEVRWVVALPDLGPEDLQDAVFKGPPVIAEGHAIIVAERRDFSRRTNVEFIVAIDVHTGALAWHRPYASMGVRPYGTQQAPADAPAVYGGDVILSSAVGVTVRVEAATGRIRWNRRVAPNINALANNEALPWEFQVPALARDRLYTLSPDRRSVLVMDPEDGARIARSPATRWGRPHTLFEHRGVLIALSRDAVVLCPADRFDEVRDAALVLTDLNAKGQNFRGRALLAGERLYIPTVDGLSWLEVPPAERFPASALELKTGRVQLDEPGNTILLEGQIITADDDRLHNYFSWSVARDVILERERETPTDSTAPTTYAQLAYRAGVTDEILPAIDRAVRALAADPLSENYDQNRVRIFDAVHAMARPDRDPSLLAVITPELRRNLLGYLERLAVSPKERAESLTSAGAYFEAIDDAPRAVEHYQRLLAQPELHEVPILVSGARTLAVDEVAARLRTVIASSGRPAYAKYDLEAERIAASLAPDAPAGEIEAFAKRYPIALVLPEMLGELGSRHEAAGDLRKAIEAYDTGLRATLPGENPAGAGELAGRAIVALARAGRFTSARLRLAERSIFHADELTYFGEPIDTAALEGHIAALEAAGQRRPIIGAEPSVQADVLPNYRIVTPVLKRSGLDRPLDRIALTHVTTGALSVWAATETGELAPAWDELPAYELLAYAHDGAYVTHLDPETKSRVFTKHDLETGAVIWSSIGFESHFDPEQNGGLTQKAIRPGVISARGGEAREVIAAISDRVLVLVERSGRALGLDAETGAPLWARQLPLERVIDLDTEGGVISVLGLRARTIEELRVDRAPNSIEDKLALIDERTGEDIRVLPLDGAAHWSRATREGRVLVGVESGVELYDPRTGRQLWRIAGQPFEEVRSLYVFPRVAYILSEMGELYAISLEDPRPIAVRVDDAQRITTSTGLVEAQPVGDRVALLSTNGFAAFNTDHQLVASDTQIESAAVLTPVLTDRYAIVLSPNGAPLADPTSELSLYALRVHDLETGLLVRDPIEIPLPQRPTALAVLDNVLIISANNATVTIPMPAGTTTERPPDPVFDLRSVLVPTEAPKEAPSEASIAAPSEAPAGQPAGDGSGER